LVINVGQLETAELDLKLKFAGLESLLFEDLCKAEVIRSSTTNGAPTGGFKGVTYGRPTDSLASERTTSLYDQSDHIEQFEKIERLEKILEQKEQSIAPVSPESAPTVIKQPADLSEDFGKMDVGSTIPSIKPVTEASKTQLTEQIRQNIKERVKAYM
jgi:hypothetical protein